MRILIVEYEPNVSMSYTERFDFLMLSLSKHENQNSRSIAAFIKRDLEENCFEVVTIKN